MQLCKPEVIQIPCPQDFWDRDIHAHKYDYLECSPLANDGTFHGSQLHLLTLPQNNIVEKLGKAPERLIALGPASGHTGLCRNLETIPAQQLSPKGRSKFTFSAKKPLGTAARLGSCLNLQPHALKLWYFSVCGINASVVWTEELFKQGQHVLGAEHSSKVWVQA